MSKARLGYAFVLGPLAGALGIPVAILAYMLATGGPAAIDFGLAAMAAFYGVLFGIPATVVIALPGFMLLRRRLGPRPLWLVLLGAGTTSVPFAAMFIAPFALRGDGSTVAAGLVVLSTITAGGALGGWVFWLIAAWRPKDARPA